MRGEYYIPYISKRGAWKCTFAEKTKRIGRIPAKKSCYGINHIVVIYLGIVIKMFISFFCNENWANFHCHRRNLASSALSSSCCVSPPASHPTPIWVELLHPHSLPFPSSELHFRLYTAGERRRAHFQGQRRHDFCWRKDLSDFERKLDSQAKGVNFGGRAF